MEDLLDAALLSRLAVDQQRAVAKGPLAQGEPFLALPLSKCWTADTAKACSKLSSYLDADAPDSTWLALHLLLVKQEQGNALQKQLQLLDDSVAGLLRWDDTELALLQGSPWMLVAGQGREEIQAEYEELLGSGSNLEELGVTLSGYLWAQASLERCLLRFLSKDGNPVEIFMPALVLLEAGSDCSLPETAADCARLELLDGQEPVLVFYAPRAISAGDPVPLCHGGLAGGSGRLLLQRGRVWPGNPWEFVEFAMTLPVPHDKMEEVSQKVFALALPPPAAGQFLVPELLEGWEPAQVEGQELQLNIRVSARKPLPQQMELLELILGDAVKARQVLRHGLLSLQKGYQSSSGYPAAGPETANPRHEAARSLLEEEKRLVALGLASLEAKAQEAAEEVDFDESALLRMQGCTVTLQEIAASFASLKAGEAEARMKLAELQVVRACLAGLPDGNPEAVHTVPLVQTKDPVLRAHGEATRAVLESRLAACEWEIATLDGSQAALQAGVMGEAAALQVKMLKFQDAYEKLAMSLQLMPSDVARRLKLDCAVALACRRQLCCDDISWSDVSKEGQLLKKRLKSLGYTASNLPQAAGVPSVLHLVSNRAGALEQKLQEQSSSPDLKDLLRLFLLRQPLPSQRVVDLLSRSVVALLLRIQALFAVADGHQLMSHQDVTAMDLTDLTAENVEIFSAVAWWPVEDLLIATDYGDTQHAAGHFEPVMYLSLDSYALIDAAPRRSAESVLDICCGSGVQGLVALHYAAKATFLDVNPRAISFSRFNAGLNGLHQRCTFLEGSVFDAKQLQGQSFQVILANPPFVPNPDGTASAAGPLYSGGGQDGEEVHKELVQKGLGLLAPGGRLCSVAEVPNPKTFPNRVGEWIDKVDCKRAGSVKIFTGKTIASEEYWKTATEERSPLEWRRYLRGLRRLGVTSVAEALLLLQLEEVGSAPLSIEAICRENLWQDVEYLRGCVAHSID